MAEVLFYHLTQSTLEQTLPVLVARTFERKQRSVIRAGSPERLAALDDLLWTFDEASFVPHGLASDANPEGQPVLLTTQDGRHNGAEVLFLIDSVPLPQDWDCKRVVVLFDEGDAEAKASARDQWKQVKALGHDCTYWQQDEGGRWVKRG